MQNEKNRGKSPDIPVQNKTKTRPKKTRKIQVQEKFLLYDPENSKEKQ